MSANQEQRRIVVTMAKEPRGHRDDPRFQRAVVHYVDSSYPLAFAYRRRKTRRSYWTVDLSTHASTSGTVAEVRAYVDALLNAVTSFVWPEPLEDDV